MSQQTIDPYGEFLDLPSGQRPPHYYDLLELELFCSHYERIHQAIHKQFRTIKAYHNHPNREMREAIQDIMNRIATARVVLTDPARKEEYDNVLAVELEIDRDAYLQGKVATPLPEFGLTVIAGASLIGRRIELVEGTACVIGSDRHCTLPLDSSRVAAQHCMIEFADGDWTVRTLEKVKAIQVNEELSRQRVLEEGDRLDIGGYRLRFERITRETGTPHTRPSEGFRQAPPLSLIVHKGATIPNPVLNTLAPQRFVIGHGESALWQLPDRTLSRHHCAIQSVSDRWEIEDLNSTNGTQINGVEVLRRLLNDRDIIGVGRFEILVSLRF
jgi:pSer/pThr/pTyr-binding forkhead associated (FHA) protein